MPVDEQEFRTEEQPGVPPTASTSLPGLKLHPSEEAGNERALAKVLMPQPGFLAAELYKGLPPAGEPGFWLQTAQGQGGPSPPARCVTLGSCCPSHWAEGWGVDSAL